MSRNAISSGILSRVNIDDKMIADVFGNAYFEGAIEFNGMGRASRIGTPVAKNRCTEIIRKWPLRSSQKRLRKDVQKTSLSFG